MTLTTQAALHWIAEVFEEKPASVTPSATPEDLQGWDSLGMLTLMAELDEKYGIFLPEDQVLGLRSIEDILAVLRAHKVLVD